MVSPTVRVRAAFGLRVLNPNRDRSWGRGRNRGWAGWDRGEGRACGDNRLRHVLVGGKASVSRVQRCPHSQVMHLHWYHLPSASGPGATKRRTVSLGQGVEKSILGKPLLSVDLSSGTNSVFSDLKCPEFWVSEEV